MNWIEELVKKEQLDYVEEDYKYIETVDGKKMNLDDKEAKKLKKALLEYVKAERLDEIKAEALNQVDYKEEDRQYIKLEYHPILVNNAEFFVHADVECSCVANGVSADYYYPGDAPEFEATEIEVELFDPEL